MNKKFLKYLAVLLLIGMFGTGCLKDKFEEFRTDPSNPTPEKASIDYYLNHVQISFRDFWGNGQNGNFYSMTDLGAEVTRMEKMYGPLYRNAYDPTFMDVLWDNAYKGVINHANTMLPLASQNQLTMHTGIARVLKAYTLMSLVDYFGDIPNSEAILGSSNINPKADPGQQVYDNALLLLDSAIDDFSAEPGLKPSNDLFYNGDLAKWTTLAKTLKLRAYMTTRLVDPSGAKANIEALLAENDLIDTDAEEFAFKYGSQLDNPVSRHPKYVLNYPAVNGGEYVGTYFLWLLTSEKPVIDPRTRYYVYRQRTTSAGWNGQVLPCGVQSRPAHFPAEMPYCILPNGYWGRDHGNNEGIPQDNEKRTTFGVYYAGGRFDNSDNVSTKQDDGARGQGLHPIWMASFTEFLKAEAALTLATAGDPKASLESGVRKSIARVMAYPAQVGITVPANRIPSDATINGYVATVLDRYDAAADDDDRLNVVMKEWYIALWGNGIDAFNNYRRTGKPDNMQLTVQSDPGEFLRSFWYPASAVNFNKSMSQKQNVTTRVFWDLNPDPLK
jgi:hypothetical protein